VRQALTHVSGVPYYHEPPNVALRLWEESPVLGSEPGESFSYSDLNYFLVALAVERVTGERWEDYVGSLEYVTGVDLVLDTELYPLPEPTHPWRDDYFGHRWAAAGIYATLPDAARFYSLLLSEPAILPPESRDLMASFETGNDLSYYGLGLAPTCPCWSEGNILKASRYGLDSWEASYVFDEPSGTVSFFFTNAWANDLESVAFDFLTVHDTVLDAIGERPLELVTPSL
jgi:CubicO group peptidase (beta-lactamase class C family)